MLDKYEQNSLIRFWLGPALFIFVNEPKLIELVLSSPKCLEKSFFYKFLRLDKGLLSSKRELFAQFANKFEILKLKFFSDDSWEIHRKFMECSFKQNIIKSFIPVFVDSADQMLASLAEVEDRSKVDIFKFTSRCALTMVLSTSFGMSATEIHFSDDILKAVEE